MKRIASLAVGLLLLFPQWILAACPGLNLNIAPSQSVYCGLPANITLNNTSSGGNSGSATYDWYRNGVLFTSTNGPINVMDAIGTAGTYSYTVIAISGGCRDTATFSVSVFPSPAPAFSFSPTNGCPGVPITFTNTSSGTVPGTTYSWDFGDAGSSSATSPNHTYAGAGTYMVTLTQTNGAGCVSTFSQNITISPPPTAGFSFNPNNSCPYTNIVFTNTSTGVLPGATYLWNFGDGSTSTSANPTHSYGFPGGTFNVTLTVTNSAGCTGVISQPVTVSPSPNINISGDDGDGNTVFCLTAIDTNTVDIVTFFNTTTGAVNYSWNYGDGTPVFNTASSAPHAHTFASFGTFFVELTATGPNGCVSRDTIMVIFDKFVSASFSIPLNETSGCLPHTVHPVNASQNANIYTWNFGDGTPPVTTTSPIPPAHSYATPGSYTVTLTAANGCNTSISTVGPITIGGPPIVNFNPSPNPGCAPQLVSMNNSTTGAAPNTNYFWNFGHGPGDTLRGVRNPPAQLYYQGTYTIMLISGNACGTDTMYRTIVIDSIPRIRIVAAPTNGCTPLTVTVTNNSQGNSATSAWYIDGGLCCPISPNYTTFNIPPQVFTAPAGTASVVHSIRYVLSNHCGTRDTTIFIRVHPQVVANFSQSANSICVGSAVTFTQTSFGDSLTYLWDFGNGNTSTAAGPHSQTYSNPGTYVISLIVQGYCGRDTLTRTLTVNPYPTAYFTANPDTGCVPLITSFTNLSTPGGTYSWNFGAGSAPGTSNVFSPPVVTYSTIGIKTVTLSVTLNGCTSIFRDTVLVNPKPTVAFTALPSSGCSPLTVSFNNTSASGVGFVWFWDFGDGTTSGLQNPPAHVYSNPGGVNLIRTIKLVVTNQFGCKDSLTRNITVFPLPQSNFSNANSACAGSSVLFSNTSIGATSYNWAFGDGGTSTAANPSHAYSNPGTYSVSLIAITNNGCRDTTTGSITIDTIPDANFVADTVCIGNTTSFLDLSVNGPVSWAWTFGDGGNSLLQNPTHSYVSASTFNVKLVVQNAIGCRDSLIKAVLVRPVPIANFSSPPACFGASSQFTNTSTGGPTSWNWDFGDGGTAAVSNPSHLYGSPGTFPVTLIVVTGVGCSDTLTLNHLVNPVPIANFWADTVCYLDTTTFVSNSGGNPTTYTWLWGDGSSNTLNLDSLTHSYGYADTFQVSLIAGYAATGCRDTSTVPVIVRPTPVANFATGPVCLNDTTWFSDLSSATPISWGWSFGDGATSISQNPNHVYLAAGTYSVGLLAINTFGCQDSVQIPVTVNPLPVAGWNADTVCQNLWTQFQDQSIGVVDWIWSFGDGTGDSLPSPLHNYDTSGTYSVSQIVINGFGCRDTLVNSIIVRPLPTAEFANSIACFGYPTLFSDSSQNAVSWSWDFGDSLGFSAASDPNYIFPSDGVFSTTLIVQNMYGCGDTIIHPVVVKPIPVAGFTAPTLCARQLIQFTDTTQNNPDSWVWDFGDGSGATIQHPSHVFDPGNTYAITLIAGNSAGCYDTLITSVVVNTVPVPAFSADTVCQGTPTSFVDGSTDPNPLFWYWDFGDGNNSNLQNPNYIYPDSGFFVVELTTSNIWGCRDSLTHLIYVAPVPIAYFEADSVCMGSPTVFADSSSAFSTSWNWNFGDGGSSSQQNPTHIFSQAGNQTVGLVVTTDFGCSDSLVKNVVALPAPTADFEFSPILCATRQVDFEDLSYNGATAWAWDFGTGVGSSLQNPSFSFDSAGIYQVSLIASNSIGCPDTLLQTITVFSNPVAQFQADTSCLGTPTFFQNLSSGDSIIQWSWDFGNGSNTSYAQDPGYIFYPSPGNFTVTLVATTDHGCADTSSSPVLVVPIPAAGFSSAPPIPTTISLLNATVSFVNQSMNAVGFEWMFGDGATSSDANPTHTYSETGTYCVQLVAYSLGACTDTLIVCNLEVIADKPDIPNTITPNGDGNNDFFVIRNIDAFPNNTLTIFNRWGNKVYEKEGYHNEWDGRHWRTGEILPDGAYFFIFKPGDGYEDVVGDVVIFR